MLLKILISIKNKWVMFLFRSIKKKKGERKVFHCAGLRRQLHTQFILQLDKRQFKYEDQRSLKNKFLMPIFLWKNFFGHYASFQN